MAPSILAVPPNSTASLPTVPVLDTTIDGAVRNTSPATVPATVALTPTPLSDPSIEPVGDTTTEPEENTVTDPVTWPVIVRSPVNITRSPSTTPSIVLLTDVT